LNIKRKVIAVVVSVFVGADAGGAAGAGGSCCNGSWFISCP
jgi:hypothetical protein